MKEIVINVNSKRILNESQIKLFEEFLKLANELENGIHHCIKKRFFIDKSYGWLAVSTQDNKREVMWTSHEESHYPHSNSISSSAYSINYTKEKILCIFKSAISMWFVHEEDDQDEAIRFMIDKLQKLI